MRIHALTRAHSWRHCGGSRDQWRVDNEGKVCFKDSEPAQSDSRPSPALQHNVGTKVQPEPIAIGDLDDGVDFIASPIDVDEITEAEPELAPPIGRTKMSKQDRREPKVPINLDALDTPIDPPPIPNVKTLESLHSWLMEYLSKSAHTTTHLIGLTFCNR